MSFPETIPDDYQERARALRAKFFPKAQPIAKLSRQRRIQSVFFPGRVYGPFTIDAAFTFDFETSRGTARQIIRETAGRHGMLIEHLLGRRRDSKVVAARQDAMARVYEACPHLSMVQIGNTFNRHHTTTLHAVKKLGVWRGASQ